MAPYRQPTGNATKQRIRATLRAALQDALREGLVETNVAELVKLPSGKRPKPLVWIPERTARWHTTGERPSPVMVWTPQQTATFLQHVAQHRLATLYQLVAFTGLRRGEACGLRWSDLDLTAGTLTCAWQITQLGWTTLQAGPPKSEAGERVIALDRRTTAALQQHQHRQNNERRSAGPAWTDSGYVFTQADGRPLHPAEISTQFQRLAREAALPPIRLHDLRHGAATHALSAGVDIKVVQEMLGHSTSVLTRDTYTSVIDETKRAATEAIATLIDSANTTTNSAGTDVTTLLPHQGDLDEGRPS